MLYGVIAVKLDSIKEKLKWRSAAAFFAVFFFILLVTGAAKGIGTQYQMSKIALGQDATIVYRGESGQDGGSSLMALDQRRENFESLYGEIADRNAILKQLEGVGDYIEVNLTMNLDRIVRLAQETPLNLQESALLLGYCDKLNFKPSIILGLIELESNFKKYEVGTSQDRGYMQIIPGTEKWLAYRYGYRLGIQYDVSKIFEPEYNFGLGIIYLDHLKRVHGENYHKILSEYNRGPYNLQKYFNKNNTYQTSYSILVLKKADKYERFD